MLNFQIYLLFTFLQTYIHISEGIIMANFLKDLPCRNAENFTKINPDTCHRSSTSKKSTYIPVKDIPADQVIVTEKTNILLR